MAPAFKTIDEYIQSFPPDVQEILQTLRETIHEVAPEAQEAVRYKMPTFILHGDLVHFAGWKKHVSLYSVTAEMEAAIPELADYETSGVTLKLPYSKPLPLALIRAFVNFRLQENIRNKDK